MSSFDAEAFKRQEAAAYSDRANDWVARGDGLQKVTDSLLDALSLQAGDQVIDIACGPGWTALAAAERVGPTGRVLAVDIAPGMVAATRRQAADAGDTWIETGVMDAEQLAVPDATFDALVCRSGIIHFPAPERAVAEMYRVLRPGGRVAVSAWGPEERMLPLSIITTCIEEVAPERFSAEMPSWFAFGARGALTHLLAEAGFDSLWEQTIPGTRQYDSPAAYWERQTAFSGKLRFMLDSLSEQDRAMVRRCALARVGAFSADDGPIVLPMDAIVAGGRQP